MPGIEMLVLSCAVAIAVNASQFMVLVSGVSTWGCYRGSVPLPAQATNGTLASTPQYVCPDMMILAMPTLPAFYRIVYPPLLPFPGPLQCDQLPGARTR